MREGARKGVLPSHWTAAACEFSRPVFWGVRSTLEGNRSCPCSSQRSGVPRLGADPHAADTGTVSPKLPEPVGRPGLGRQRSGCPAAGSRGGLVSSSLRWCAYVLQVLRYLASEGPYTRTAPPWAPCAVTYVASAAQEGVSVHHEAGQGACE